MLGRTGHPKQKGLPKGALFAWSARVSFKTPPMAAAPAPREVPPPWEVPQLCQLHGAEFAVGDLAQTQRFSSLCTHRSAVSRRRVRHNTGTSRFLAAGLGHGSCLSLNFCTGAVGIELKSVLRAIGFISLSTKSGESSNSSDREETGSLVHDANPWIKSVSKRPGQKPFLNRVR
jgi:hypothetical protein